MRKFESLFKIGTKVKVAGMPAWDSVKEIHASRQWVKLEKLGKKMINKYRIQFGTVYEWDGEMNAYICIGNTLQYSKKQISEMRKEKCSESHTIYRENDHE